MIKQKVRNAWQSCVRVLSKWKATRTSIRIMIWFVAAFGLGWLVCYATTPNVSPTTLAVLAGFMAGFMITPISWLSMAGLLHEVDQERHANELATLDAINERFAQLDKHYQDSILKRWQVGE